MSFVGTVQNALFIALGLIVIGICLFALADALRRPAAAFQYAEKRTKGFWCGILAGAVLFALLGIPPLGIVLFLLLGVIPAGIYLADVRPAVRNYRERGGGGSTW